MWQWSAASRLQFFTEISSLELKQVTLFLQPLPWSPSSWRLWPVAIKNDFKTHFLWKIDSTNISLQWIWLLQLANLVIDWLIGYKFSINRLLPGWISLKKHGWIQDLWKGGKGLLMQQVLKMQPRKGIYWHFLSDRKKNENIDCEIRHFLHFQLLI